MRRFVAFPLVVVLLLAFAASGWSAAPGSAPPGPQGPAVGTLQVPDAPAVAESGTWTGPTASGTLGLRANAGSRASGDGPQDHVLGRMGIQAGSAGPAPAAAVLPAPVPGLPRRTPLPPFVTTLPPPVDVRT